jgi:ubiquinone/menaquinone biosynthesis C-methylase UbiE
MDFRLGIRPVDGRWSRLLVEQFLECLEISSGARCLDVCGGGGIVTELIAERCSPMSVVGIDATPAQIEFAEHRKRPIVMFEVCDATTIPFSDSTFGVVVCGVGLNYISDQPWPLRGMRRLTRADGHCRGLRVGLRRGQAFSVDSGM